MNANTPSVEDVLDQFMMEDRHDGATLESYLRKHPQFAVELIDFSRLAAAPDEEDDGPLSATDQSRIDTAWITHQAAGHSEATDEDPFTTLTGARGKAMSVTLGVPRQVITCFREKRVDPSTVPRPVVRHFANQFDLPMPQVIEALARPAATVKTGRSFKAAGKPGTGKRVSFEQVLIDAGVSDADRAHLLADD